VQAELTTADTVDVIATVAADLLHRCAASGWAPGTDEAVREVLQVRPLDWVHEPLVTARCPHGVHRSGNAWHTMVQACVQLCGAMRPAKLLRCRSWSPSWSPGAGRMTGARRGIDTLPNPPDLLSVILDGLHGGHLDP
jgi:hypothetical protein